MQNNNENNFRGSQDSDDDDRREFNSNQQNKESYNNSNFDINEQENTGVPRKIIHSENNSYNMSQNNNMLINKDNNVNSTLEPGQSSQQSNNQNNSNQAQVNNFMNSNNNNSQNNNIGNQGFSPDNNNNKNSNNNNNYQFNSQNPNDNFNNYQNNNNQNMNYNNNNCNFNNMNPIGNANHNQDNQGQFINQNNINNNQNNINQMNNNNQMNINQMNNQGKPAVPFSNIQQPSKTLLVNLGDTDYLNAVLHLIGSIRVFCEYFYIPNKDNNFVKNIEKAPLAFIIHRLFLHLYPENSQSIPYKPDAIKRYLSEINCVYKSEKKRNPNELISFILDTLHNELKKSPKVALQSPNNVLNKNEVIKVGIKNFQNCELSKISQYFNWFEIKEVNCTQCNQSMFSFHTYHMIELDILNTFNCFKNNSNNNNCNYITIYDCLTYYQRVKNNMRSFCKYCNKNTNVNCASKILSNPNIFIFSLNRGLINGNFDDNLTKINFKLDEKIDLNNFVENNNISKQYELIGIVSISERLNNYVSYCKSPVDKNWYYYDNQNVNPYNINYILSEHNNNNDNDKNCIPCILVYQLIN